MYLTRLTFDPASPRALRLLGDPYAMHQFVWNAFADGHKPNQGGERDILWRVEPERDRPPATLVLSRTAPDWGWPLSAPLLKPPEVKTWEPAFERGQRFGFRLRANPTKRIHVDAKRPGVTLEKGMRVALLKEAEQVGWLIDRAAKHGFRVSDKMLRPGDPGYEPCQDWFRVEREATWQTDQARGEAGRHRMTWLAVDYEGTLEVADAEAFGSAIREGVGPAKAFGFGLLSIAPAR